MASLYSFGPGLTSQLGPFKTNRNDYPKKSKLGRGGGVPAGGSLHAGHGNWKQTMNPKTLKASPFALEPSQYASIVVPSRDQRQPSAGRFSTQTKPLSTSGVMGNYQGQSQGGLSTSETKAQLTDGGLSGENNPGVTGGEEFNAMDYYSVLPKKEEMVFKVESSPATLPGSFPDVKDNSTETLGKSSNSTGIQTDPDSMERELSKFYTNILADNERLQTIGAEAGEYATQAASNKYQGIMKGILNKFGFPTSEQEVDANHFNQTMQQLGMTQDALMRDRNAMADFISRYQIKEAKTYANAYSQSVRDNPPSSSSSLLQQNIDLSSGLSGYHAFKDAAGGVASTPAEQRQSRVGRIKTSGLDRFNNKRPPRGMKKETVNEYNYPYKANHKTQAEIHKEMGINNIVHLTGSG